jgi:hypothetical protein
MSGATTAAWVTAAAAAASTAVAYDSAQDQKKQAKKAAAQAEQMAVKQEKAADQAFNRANQKKPNAGAMAAANQQTALAGGAGTMLTGAMGVAPDELQLGKNTLLGQ